MSYAGITKGFTALGAAMMLAATRGGSAQALKAELAESRPDLLAYLKRQTPDMYGKAYRWVTELDEISEFVGKDRPEHAMLKAAHPSAAPPRLSRHHLEPAGPAQRPQRRHAS